MTDRSTTSTRLPGVSELEQALYDHVVAHVDGEVAVLREYEALARSTDSPAFAYLAGLILEDERRHHQLLRDLAETIRIDSSMSGEPTPIPPLSLFRSDRAAIRDQTGRLLDLEREDNKELARLAKQLEDFGETTLWQLVVRILQADNDKHQLILRFVAERAKHRF